MCVHWIPQAGRLHLPRNWLQNRYQDAADDADAADADAAAADDAAAAAAVVVVAAAAAVAAVAAAVAAAVKYKQPSVLTKMY